MKDLPHTDNALVIRTDFSDEGGWSHVCQQIEAPVGDFRAHVSFVDDPVFDGISVDEMTALGQRGPYRSFLFVVDRYCLQNPEHPVLVLDLLEEPGQTFRVVPREMWSIENNLSLANMDFSDFAGSADPDGVFRGFPAD